MPQKTVLLHPIADGLPLQWTPTAPAAAHYLLINGNPLASDDGASEIHSTAIGQRERFSLGTAPASLDSVNSLVWRFRAAGTENLGLEDSVEIRMFVGGVRLLPQQSIIESIGLRSGGVFTTFVRSLPFTFTRKQPLEVELVCAGFEGGVFLSDMDFELTYNDPLATEFTPLTPPTTVFTPIL